LEEPFNKIFLSLCSDQEFKSGDLATCMEKAIFSGPSIKRIEAEWLSVKQPFLSPLSKYWLVLEGDGASFQTAFSWLDCPLFNATTAYKGEDQADWIVEPFHLHGSSLVFTAINV